MFLELEGDKDLKFVTAEGAATIEGTAGTPTAITVPRGPV